MIYVLCNGGLDDGALAFSGLDMFYDIKGHWAENYINYCASLGILAGRGNGRFDPNAPVTGYELAKMLLVVAKYDPSIQVYTGDKWKINVLRDAQRAGLTDGYDWLMDQPAPRQWAAKMFATLILDVEVAQYIGDLLVTGSGLNWTNGKTVGQERLKLIMFKAELIQTKTLNIGGGPDEYSHSIVDTADHDNIGDIALAFEASNNLLGQEVMVVGKANNTNLSGPALVNEKNMTTLAVYSTGLSRVYDTTRAGITIGRNNSTSDNQLTIQISGYNGGNAKHYPLSGVDTSGQPLYELLNNVYGNDFTAYNINTATLDTVGTASNIYNNVAPFNRAGNDPVRAIDYDADGWIDYIFFSEIYYSQVTSITNNRFTAGSMSVDPADVIFTNGEPEVGDVIAVIETYVTGDVQYEVRIIEPTENVSVTKWLNATSGVSSVTIEGKNYTRVTNPFNAGDYTHQVFYLDGNYFAGSAVAAGQSTESVPSNLAVVTNISGYMNGTPTNNGNNNGPVLGTDSVGNPNSTYSFKVEYVTVDGKKSGSKTYSHTNGTNDIGTKTNWLSATGTSVAWADSTKFANGGVAWNDVGAQNVAAKTNVNYVWDAVRNLIQLNNTTTGLNFVRVRENSDGTVTFYDASAIIDKTPTYGTHKASYTVKTRALSYQGSVSYVTDDTLVFFRYNTTIPAAANSEHIGGTYKMVKGSELYAFDSTTGSGLYVESIVTNSRTGEVLAVYIVTANSTLPQASTYKYAIITGSSFRMMKGNQGDDCKVITALGEDGKAFDLLFPESETVTNRWKLVRYTTSTSDNDNKPVVMGTATVSMSGTISYVYSDYLMFNDKNVSKRVNYDANTVVFDVSNNNVTASVRNMPYASATSTNQNVAIITDDSDSNLAKIILINADFNTVGGNNLTATATGMSVIIGSKGHGTYAKPGDTLTSAVSNAYGALTYSWHDGTSVVGTAATLPVTTGMEGRTLTLTVTEAGTASGSNTATATVVVAKNIKTFNEAGATTPATDRAINIANFNTTTGVIGVGAMTLSISQGNHGTLVGTVAYTVSGTSLHADTKINAGALEIHADDYGKTLTVKATAPGYYGELELVLNVAADINDMFKFVIVDSTNALYTTAGAIAAGTYKVALQNKQTNAIITGEANMLAALDSAGSLTYAWDNTIAGANTTPNTETVTVVISTTVGDKISVVVAYTPGTALYNGTLSATNRTATVNATH